MWILVDFHRATNQHETVVGPHQNVILGQAQGHQRDALYVDLFTGSSEAARTAWNNLRIKQGVEFIFGQEQESSQASLQAHDRVLELGQKRDLLTACVVLHCQSRHQPGHGRINLNQSKCFPSTTIGNLGKP